MASVNHKYIPRTDPYQNNLFVEEYYSSSDVTITMNDEEQKEIGYINYTVQEQLKPIYGYDARTFDDVAIGNRIVTGTFKVSIKNPNEQDSLETMTSKLKENWKDNTTTYNEQQLAEYEKNEWIQTSNDEVSTNNTNSDRDSEILDYQTYIGKLYSLSYTNSYYTTLEDAKELIKKWQSENKINGDGTLTEETKNKINQALENKHYE